MRETVLQKRRNSLRESYRQRALRRIDRAAQRLYSPGAYEVYVFISVFKPEIFDENSDVVLAMKIFPLIYCFLMKNSVQK